eukprot:Awhi_evm1s409
MCIHAEPVDEGIIAIFTLIWSTSQTKYKSFFLFFNVSNAKVKWVVTNAWSKESLFLLRPN